MVILDEVPGYKWYELIAPRRKCWQAVCEGWDIDGDASACCASCWLAGGFASLWSSLASHASTTNRVFTTFAQRFELPGQLPLMLDTLQYNQFSCLFPERIQLLFSGMGRTLVDGKVWL